MPKKTSPHSTMLNLIIGYWISRLIQVAATLNIADLLKSGPRTAQELAKAAHVRAPQLYRLLRALASVGVFAETKSGRFKLTPLAATLQTGVPGSMRTTALMLNADWQWDAWQKLLAGVASDDVPFVKAHGMSVFEYLEKHPDDLAAFHESATGLTNPAIAAAYNFSKFRTLVDIGGSHGALLSTILKAHPSLKGVLFDQPSVIAGAKKSRHLTDPGIARRCRLESGSFFVSVPSGADAYILKYILHDWDKKLPDSSLQRLAIPGSVRCRLFFAPAITEGWSKSTPFKDGCAFKMVFSQAAMRSTYVYERAEFRKVICGRDCRIGQSGRQLVKSRQIVGVFLKILENRHAVRFDKRRIVACDARQQLLPGVPLPIGIQHQRCCPHGSRDAGLQCGRKRRQFKSSAFGLSENADARQSTKQAIKLRCANMRGLCQFLRRAPDPTSEGRQCSASRRPG